MHQFVRYAAMVVSLVECCVLLAYYLPMLSQVPLSMLIADASAVDPGPYDDNYVSDLLFNNSTYRWMMTSLVGLHLCACSFFVVCLNRHENHWGCFPVMVAELICLVIAWLGWTFLSAVYLGMDGKISVGHVIGAGVFIAACGLYFGLMACNVAAISLRPWTRLEWFVFGLVALLFVSSLATGCLFVSSFFQKEITFGWMYEHAAFVLFAGAHVLLFVLDGQFEAEEEEGPALVANVFQGTKIDLRSSRKEGP